MAGLEIEITPAAGWDGLADTLERLAAGQPAGAAPGDGRVLRLAAGDYTGDRPLRLPAGLTLDGSAGARLCWTGRGSALHLIGTGPGTRANGAVVRGLRVEALGPFPDAAPAGSTDALILIQDATGVRIEGCIVRGGADHLHGLLVRGGTAIHIEGCEVSGCLNGIVILSSLGVEARGNRCHGNLGSGLVAALDPDHPARPCYCRFIDNRCHDNQGAGIGFVSAWGHAEYNDCWGNAISGIVLQRDPQSPEAPAIADLIANRCHDNQQSGIVLFSSAGRAEGNDCWGNANFGIALQRDPQSPEAPAIADLIANRCHDNQGSGIGLFSSAGRAEGNDCWGNAYYGIELQRDSKSPEAPAIADLIANRCDHNRDVGIAFFSSDGHCDANQCWHNGLADGIGQRRQPGDPTRPPYRTQLPDCRVRIGTQLTEPPDPAVLAAARCAVRPDRALVAALAVELGTGPGTGRARTMSGTRVRTGPRRSRTFSAAVARTVSGASGSGLCRRHRPAGARRRCRAGGPQRGCASTH